MKDPFQRSDPFRNSNRGGPTKLYYTVMVKGTDGSVTMHERIENPWKYIEAVKASPNVESAWIKK